MNSSDPGRFDPNAAAQPGRGVFGLPDSEATAAVVLVPVPFAATVSYGADEAAVTIVPEPSDG